MKYFKSITIAFYIVAIASCNKITTETPDFTVAINKNSFAVGDTVKFQLSGTPANVVFYSGEAGNNYDTRNVFTATGGAPEMTFTTALTASTGSSTATNVNLMVSNNFTGKYNQTDILAATWTDITSSIAVPGSNQRVVLTPYVTQGKPIYVAFKFQTVDTSKSQRLLTISNFSFKTVYQNQAYQNAINVYDAGFSAYDFAGVIGKWVIPITSTSNTSFTHPFVAANSAADNDWAISKAMETNAVLPGKGIALKAISNDVLTEYKYVFTKAGTYKIVFVASNNTNQDYHEVVREFNVTVN
ncbi:MAG: DUF5017 domain-containing protein [Chitinophagaceae bacterium]